MKAVRARNSVRAVINSRVTITDTMEWSWSDHKGGYSGQTLLARGRNSVG